jgi:hypothetical protein
MNHPDCPFLADDLDACTMHVDPGEWAAENEAAAYEALRIWIEAAPR